MAKYRREHAIEFFKPIEPYQTKVFEYLKAGKKIIALVGSNGIGKTFLGSHIIGSFCYGVEPWSGEPSIFGNRPVKGRIICSDWEKHAKEVIVPKLKEVLSVGTYTTSKNNVGVDSIFKFDNGSTVELITNKQATSDHEGWQGDFVWADEPFDREKFVANLRGLRNPESPGGLGIFLITMTAVSQPWILDDIVLNPDPAYASVTDIPQDANPYLSEDYKRVFRASLNEEEKVARIFGGWLNLWGLVWKGFKPDVHLIEDFKIPTTWPVVALIDFHMSKPQAISYYATDPLGRWYVIDETWANISSEEVADDIIRHKVSNAWRLEEAFIDPLSKGDSAYLKNRMGYVQDSFSVIQNRLVGHQISLDVASKDKVSGIRNIESMLTGPNGMPMLFFFRQALSRIQKEGHIWEIQRWTYDDNEPADENDHFMENLYRMSLTGVKYTDPMLYAHKDRAETDFSVWGERNQYAANAQR